jgi:hypothetical protein
MPACRPSDAYVFIAPRLTPHQNIWHARANLDWWEVDLGAEYPVTKVTHPSLAPPTAALSRDTPPLIQVVFYNRRECCQDRSQDALVTLMDSGRNVVQSATLNSNAVQQFNFAPYAGVYRFYMMDGSHRNQLWLVNEVRQANVPCASASFDHTYVARSNWGHDALFSGRIGYFSFQNGVMSYGAAANLASQVWQAPQSAPGNFLRTNAIMVPGYMNFNDVFVNPANTRPQIGKGGLFKRPAMFNRDLQKCTRPPAPPCSPPPPHPYTPAATSTSAAQWPSPTRASPLSPPSPSPA